LPAILSELPGDASASSSAARAGFQQHTASDEGYDADVTTDPTGKWIVFSSTRHSEHPHIYTQRVDGTAVTQLTGEDADDAQPVFSPDGKRIAFCSTRGGNWDIYLMDADGRNLEQVTNAPAQEMHPSFSPDGARLVYCALSTRSDQWELWTINLATHERKMIGNGIFPVWSPAKDHDRIAFQRARQRGSHCFSLWTIDLVDGEPRRMTDVAASANAAVISPTWSPDGSFLAFTTILLPSEGSSIQKRQQDIWVVASDGSARRRLTDGNAVNLSPSWAVDNRIYFISDRGGHDNIWSMRVDGASHTGTATATAPPAPTPGAIGEPQANKSTDGKAATAEKPAAVGATDNREVGH
jgi:Tol biopolymer transport system component